MKVDPNLHAPRQWHYYAIETATSQRDSNGRPVCHMVTPCFDNQPEAEAALNQLPPTSNARTMHKACNV